MAEPDVSENQVPGAPSRVEFGQIARFGIAGLTSTLFYFLISAAFVALAHIPPSQASLLAYVLSLGVSYGLQSRFTFRQESDTIGRSLRFVVSAVLGLAVSYLLVFLTTEILHWWYIVGTAAVCVVLPIANYFVLKFWVFTTVD